MIDWTAAALAAQRARCAYLDDIGQSQTAFAALGDRWVDLIRGIDYQAVLTIDTAGATHLSISGTRASDAALIDMFDDIDLTPAEVQGGAVTAGVLSGQDRLWQRVLASTGPGTVINVAGHSLGASRTHLAPLFLPAAQTGALYSFEAPKFCDADYYATYAATLAGMVCTLNGQDAYATYPWFDARWQARPQQDHVWLLPQGYRMIPPSQWPGGTSFADHAIELICERLTKIAAAHGPPSVPAGMS